MTQSRIDSSVIYTEIKKLNKDDIDYDAPIYEVEFFPHISNLIALGNVNYSVSKKDILYIPVYLIKNEKVIYQIGVYEFIATNYENLLDKEGDFDISLLENTNPLFYSFATPDLIKKYSTSEAEEDGDAEEDGESNTTEEEKETNLEKIIKFLNMEDTEALPEIDKTKNDDLTEIQKYKKKSSDLWIQKFLKNVNYNIKDNEGGGECFFAIIRDALLGIKKNISVKQLREELSKNANENIFKTFKEQYTMYYNLIKISQKQLKGLQEEIKILGKEIKKEADHMKKRAIFKIAKLKTSEFKKIKKEQHEAKDLLKDFKFMKNIKNLQAFRLLIKTCKFWANTWSINTLEILLNVKIILLSSQNYKEGDLANVLVCGNAVSDIIEKRGYFKPSYYILADYTGDHYKLITYKNQRIFKFDQIPFSIKNLIINKCLEKDAGIYSFIPKFKELKNLKVVKKSESQEEEEEKEEEEAKLEGDKEELFDPSIVFQFYSKSGDKKPGKGSGEKIDEKDRIKFAELASIKNWRKTLSNFAETPFTLDGLKWKGVEWYYQGAKFKKNNPEFYKKFSLESGSEISQDAVLAKSAGGKTGKRKGKQLRPKEIKVDEDFFGGDNPRGIKEMNDAQEAKYNQNADAKQVLLATKNAKLVHYLGRGQGTIVFNNSMRIRKNLEKS